MIDGFRWEGNVTEMSSGGLVMLFLLGVVIALWQLAVVVNYRGYADRNLHRATRWTHGFTSPERQRADREAGRIMQVVVCSIIMLAGIGIAAYAVIVSIMRLI